MPFCERNKLLDIKYAMHHLSARTAFVTRPRLALKAIDSLIPSAEAYNHVPWVYALRFLRVSFSFKLGSSHQDVASAVQNLKAISQLAADNDDGAVSLLSATYEAMFHLRSMTASSAEDAKRAVAAAKSLQFHPLAQALDQVWALLDCVEIICCLVEGNHNMAAQKAEQMAPRMDDYHAHPNVEENGQLLVPLQGSPTSLTENTSGIFLQINNTDHLQFRWLPRRDLWAFCYLLNAIAAQTRGFAESKAETYIQQGLKLIKENMGDANLNQEAILPSTSPLNAAVQRLDWWYNLQWCLDIYMTINACSRAEWAIAVGNLDEAVSAPPMMSDGNGDLRARWETYLRATILQGTGECEQALSMFQSESLRLSASPSHKIQALELDLSILATLNSILITINPMHPQHGLASELHQVVLPFIMNHPNKSFRAAHDLLRSVLYPQDKLIDKKKHFHNCLAAARTVNNTQLVSIALTLMCTMFFNNVVGEQAQKSVSSARALADRSKSNLWRGVAAGLQEQTALRHGNEKDALMAGRDGERLMDSLPAAVKARFGTNLS